MSDDVTRALQSVKYNETVQIVVTDDEGNSQEISLVASLDRENGGVQWIQADPDTRVQRHLRTKRWIFPMLNDHCRNELYDKAIQRASEEVSRRYKSSHSLKEGDSAVLHGLDIGSGTGLLAMMSARSLNQISSSAFVTSLEMSSAMAQIARETVAANHVQDSVKVVEAHSCEMPPLDPKAMLCTSELLESGLLGEGWIPAMRDAWQRHLDPSAVVVPRGARVYCRIVEGKGLVNFWGPHQKLDGFPNNKSLSLSLDNEETCFLLHGEHGGVQVPIHVSTLLEDPDYPIRFLSETINALEIRVDSKDALPPPEGQKCSTIFVPSATGVAHGVLFWWDLELFGVDLSYNTGPEMGPWQDHWHQCLFVFSSQECLQVEKGVAATLQTSHNDSSVFFTIVPGDSTASHKEAKRPRAVAPDTKLISPLRAWQLNDVDRSTALRDGISTLLSQRGIDSVVLDLSDFSLCAMMAALLGATNVTSLEASASELPESTARIAQIANALPLSGSNNFQLIRCHREQLTVDLLGGKPAEIVLAEPYYEILEGWVVQEALDFFHTLRKLKNRGVVRPDAMILPSYAKFMACAIESKHVWDAYRQCDSQIRGFRHDVVNHYHTIYDHDLSLPSWQYQISNLSEPFELGMLDYSMGTMVECESQTVPFRRIGTCHGILVWVEYGIPSRDTATNVLSTRGRSYHQIIRMLKEPALGLTPADRLSCKLSFSAFEQDGYDYKFEIFVQRSGTVGHNP